MKTEVTATTTAGRLLVVDDNTTQLYMVREILEAESYIVQQAQSGVEALALLACQDFDTVLLDQRMPGLSGDEVCRLIRSTPRLSLLPVIIVTGCDHAKLSLCLEAGATDFVRKPYNAIELVARVNAAVRQKRKTDELDNAESLLFALARMVEAKDEQTGDHCTRLAHTAVVFGEALGLGAADLEALRRGGVLHDIGKLVVPDKVLLKNSALDELEWDIMRQHTVVGARLCQGLLLPKAYLKKRREQILSCFKSHTLRLIC